MVVLREYLKRTGFLLVGEIQCLAFVEQMFRLSCQSCVQRDILCLDVILQ